MKPTVNPAKAGIQGCYRQTFPFLLFGFLFVTDAFSDSAIHTNSIGINMLPIPAGTFQMGNPSPEKDSWDEAPVHEVTIDQPFFISETEITVEQFQQFRPGFTGAVTEPPYATGLSWYDAVAFCEWLSEKEGKPYRLPTEAEWEYAARAGSDTAFWSGENPPELGTPNSYGLKNIHSGPLEWIHDWYGPYPYEDQADPVGAAHGLARVLRGGGLDIKEPYFARSTNRAGIAPSFAMMKGTRPEQEDGDKELSDDPDLEGLIGIWYGTTQFGAPKNVDQIVSLDMNWDKWQQPGQDRETKWSGRWEGALLAPHSGEVTFEVESDYAVTLRVAGETAVEWEGREAAQSGSVSMEQGKKVPLEITYVHNLGESSYLRILWSWEGQNKTIVPKTNLFHSSRQQEKYEDEAPDTFLPGHHSIGFRIVQAPMPESKPYDPPKPFHSQCVVQDQPMLKQGPDPNRPWYRRRRLISMPPHMVGRDQTRAVGMSHAMKPFNVAQGIDVLSNGDLFMGALSAELGPRGEDNPEVLMLGARLRYGAEQWDPPEVFVDFPDSNTVHPAFFTEGDTTWFFFGNTFYDRAYPFQWMTTRDSGATWSQVRFPQFIGEIGPRTNQPGTTMFRDKGGTLYVSSDGIGGTSLLWATEDNGETWRDTGGRTFGRHTSFVPLKDGRILGMGGKKSQIEGYMPKSISSDGGKTWEIGKTPFAELSSGQRPCVLRLASGRLFFAGDFQAREGYHPPDIAERGAYVALSEDEGETWLIKKLPGAVPFDEESTYETLGYTVARQAPNGLIHFVATKVTPNFHYELNEAWILDEDAPFSLVDASQVFGTEEYREHYESGQIESIRNGGVTEEGQYLLHGPQTWFYENGQKQWEVEYANGRKIGEETYWDEKGNVLWSWTHAEDGHSVWTQYWPNGKKRAESGWRDFRAEGKAYLWDRSGELLREEFFWVGRLQ
jgi:hypothetical protein